MKSKLTTAGSNRALKLRLRRTPTLSMIRGPASSPPPHDNAMLGKVKVRASTPIFRVRVSNPKGIPSLSPGLRGTSYPGKPKENTPQPQRGCIFVAGHERRRCNPFRVVGDCDRFPRVARSSQPWVEFSNPFRIVQRHQELHLTTTANVSDSVRGQNWRPHLCRGSSPTDSPCAS